MAYGTFLENATNTFPRTATGIRNVDGTRESKGTMMYFRAEALADGAVELNASRQERKVAKHP